LETRIIKRTVPALLKWFAAEARDLPWRRTSDPYGIWISEIMLQQTQVKTVIPYFERWMDSLPAVADLAKAKPEKVLKLWEGLGYYRRARHAQAAAQAIVDNHGGRFPDNFEHIRALPGIGRYTAGAISSIAFHQPTPILDGNVMRVLSRIFGVAGDPREKETNAKLWDLAQELVSVDVRHCSKLNQSLMELGALVCTPREPRCLLCPVRQDCFAFQTGRVDEFPQRTQRPKVTERRFIALVAMNKNRFLVRQRAGDVVNAHLWEFPNIEIDLTENNLAKVAKPFQIIEGKPLCRIRHSITRYRILLEAFHANAADGTPGVWKTIAELNRLPLTSAHRKVLDVLASTKIVNTRILNRSEQR
jgi:A/G-specific adenine glycosylase